MDDYPFKSSCQHIGSQIVSIFQLTTRGYVALSQLLTHPLQSCSHQVTATAANPTPQASCWSKPLPNSLAWTHCNNISTQITKSIWHYPVQHIPLFKAQQKIKWIHLMQEPFATFWVCGWDQWHNLLWKDNPVMLLPAGHRKCNHTLHNSTQLYNILQLCITVQQISHDAIQDPDTQATIHN